MFYYLTDDRDLISYRKLMCYIMQKLPSSSEMNSQNKIKSIGDIVVDVVVVVVVVVSIIVVIVGITAHLL